MDQGALIELVRQYDHIYNKKHKDFKNKLARDNAWNTIASIMEYSRDAVETTWNTLRNRFATERRKIRCVPSGSAATSGWRFYEALSFLEEHVAVRKTVGNITNHTSLWDTQFLSESEQTETTNSQEELGTTEDVNSDTPLSAPSTSQSTPPSSRGMAEHKENIQGMKKLKKRKNDVLDLEKSIVATLGSIENVFKTPAEDEDEDMLFGKCIGKSLKMIRSRKVKAKVRLEILTIFEKYEED